MRSINALLIFLLLTAANSLFSQKLNVEFIIKNDSLPKKEKRNFIYINKEIDVSTAKYIGRLRSSSKAKEMQFALIFLQQKAQKKGANSFKFVDYQTTDGVTEITIDSYVIDEPTILANNEFFPQNKIYFFGKNNAETESVEEYKVNGELKTLQSFKYTVLDLAGETSIKKGSVLGTTLNLKPTIKNNSFYLNFSGFGATGGYASGGGMGMSFSGGSIAQMDPNIALLLTNIYSSE